jgi:hypothetical protein
MQLAMACVSAPTEITLDGATFSETPLIVENQGGEAYFRFKTGNQKLSNKFVFDNADNCWSYEGKCFLEGRVDKDEKLCRATWCSNKAAHLIAKDNELYVYQVYEGPENQGRIGKPDFSKPYLKLSMLKNKGICTNKRPPQCWPGNVTTKIEAFSGNNLIGEFSATSSKDDPTPKTIMQSSPISIRGKSVTGVGCKLSTRDLGGSSQPSMRINSKSVN